MTICRLWLVVVMMCRWWHLPEATTPGEVRRLTRAEEVEAVSEPSVIATEVMMEVVCRLSNQTNCTWATETLEPIFASIYVDTLGVTSDMLTVSATCTEDMDSYQLAADILVTVPSDVSQNLSAYDPEAVEAEVGSGPGQSNPEDYFSETVQIVTLNVAKNAGVLTLGVLDVQVAEGLSAAGVDMDVVIESVSTPTVVVQTTLTSSSSSVSSSSAAGLLDTSTSTSASTSESSTSASSTSTSGTSTTSLTTLSTLTATTTSTSTTSLTTTTTSLSSTTLSTSSSATTASTRSSSSSATSTSSSTSTTSTTPTTTSTSTSTSTQTTTSTHTPPVGSEIIFDISVNVTNYTNCTESEDNLEPVFVASYVDLLGVPDSYLTVTLSCGEEFTVDSSLVGELQVDVLVQIPLDTGDGILAYNPEAVAERLESTPNPYLNQAVQIVTYNVEASLEQLTVATLKDKIQSEIDARGLHEEIFIEELGGSTVIVKTTASSSTSTSTSQSSPLTSSSSTSISSSSTSSTTSTTASSTSTSTSTTETTESSSSTSTSTSTSLTSTSSSLTSSSSSTSSSTTTSVSTSTSSSESTRSSQSTRSSSSTTSTTTTTSMSTSTSSSSQSSESSRSSHSSSTSSSTTTATTTSTQSSRSSRSSVSSKSSTTTTSTSVSSQSSTTSTSTTSSSTESTGSSLSSRSSTTSTSTTSSSTESTGSSVSSKSSTTSTSTTSSSTESTRSSTSSSTSSSSTTVSTSTSSSSTSTSTTTSTASTTSSNTVPVGSEITFDLVVNVTNYTTCAEAAEDVEAAFVASFVDWLGVPENYLIITLTCGEEFTVTGPSSSARLLEEVTDVPPFSDTPVFVDGEESAEDPTTSYLVSKLKVDVMVRIRIDTGAGIPAYNREAVEHLLNDGNPYLNEAVQIVALNVEAALARLTADELSKKVDEELAELGLGEVITIKELGSSFVVVKTTSSSTSTTPSSPLTSSSSTSTTTLTSTTSTSTVSSESSTTTSSSMTSSSSTSTSTKSSTSTRSSSSSSDTTSTSTTRSSSSHSSSISTTRSSTTSSSSTSATSPPLSTSLLVTTATTTEPVMVVQELSCSDEVVNVSSGNSSSSSSSFSGASALSGWLSSRHSASPQFRFCPTVGGTYGLTVSTSAFSPEIMITYPDRQWTRTRTGVYGHLSFQFSSAVCYDITVSSRSSSQQSGAFQIALTCCLNEMEDDVCSGRSGHQWWHWLPPVSAWQTNWFSPRPYQCRCQYCRWPYRGTNCEQCQSGYVMARSEQSGQMECLDCRGGGFSYGVAVGGGHYVWKPELPAACESQVVMHKVTYPWWQGGRQELDYDPSGMRVDMPTCTSWTSVYLSILWYTRAIVSCVSLPTCPSSANTIPVPVPSADVLMKRSSSVHIHVLQPRNSWVASLALKVLGLVIDAAESQTLPVILGENATIWLSATGSSGALRFGRAGDVVADAQAGGGAAGTSAMAHAQDRLNSHLRGERGSVPWCGLSEEDKAELFMPDGSIEEGKIIILVGERSDCPGDSETSNLKRSPSVNTITRESSRLASEFCSTLQWLDMLARLSLAGPGCQNSDQVAFFPSTVQAMRRVQLTFTGICGLQACCFGDVCSHFTSSEGGMHKCYTPLLTRLGEQPVTIVTTDGEVLNALTPLVVTEVGTSAVRVSRWGSRGWAWRIGAQQTWCSHYVAIGAENYEVLGAITPPLCHRWSWRYLPSPPNVDHEMPFTQPVGVVALRAYLPRGDSGSVDGPSSDQPAIEEMYMEDAKVVPDLKRSWYEEEKIRGYVDYLLDRKSSQASGAALPSVRKALANEGLYSSAHSEERPCEAGDVPDHNDKCYWAWSAQAGGATKFLKAAGFRCRDVGWHLFDSIAAFGDIVVMPAFEAVDNETGMSVSMPFGDIAVKHDASLAKPWVSDALRSYSWMQRMSIKATSGNPFLDASSTSSGPSLCRLRHNAGLWPEEDEVIIPYVPGQDILGTSSPTAAREAFASRVASDLAIPGFAQTIEATRSAYKCPRFWGRNTVMPRELRPRWSIFRSAEEFRCLSMTPTQWRPGGVTCCYDRRGFYVPTFPSRTTYGQPPLTQWRRIEEQGFVTLASAKVPALPGLPSSTASILDPCRRTSDDAMCLPRPDIEYEMACLADGVKRGTAGCASAAQWRVLDDTICHSGFWGWGEDCLVVYARNSDECAIAFKGSDALWDWTDNLDYGAANFSYWQQPSEGRPHLEVHEGFYQEYLRHRVDELGTYLTGHPQCSKNIYMVGHSQGAALATLLFLDMGIMKSNAHLFAFAAPRLLHNDVSGLSCDRAKRFVLTSPGMSYPDPVTFMAPSAAWHSYGAPVVLERSWTATPARTVAACNSDTVVRLPDNRDVNEHVAQCLPALSQLAVTFIGSVLCPACGVAKTLLRSSTAAHALVECQELLTEASDLVQAIDELHGVSEYVNALEQRWCALREDTAWMATSSSEPMCPPQPPEGTNSPFLPGSGWTPRRPPFFGWGDPHCSSLDGKEFECNFLGEAIYAACGTWKVHVGTVVVGDGGGTAINAMAISLGNDTLTISPRTPDSDSDEAGSDDNSTDGDDNSTNSSDDSVVVTSLYTLRLNGEEADFEVDTPDFGMIVTVDPADSVVTIEDRDGKHFEVRVTLRPTFMSPVEVTPSDDCYGSMEGLVGNGNGNTSDDYMPRHAEEPLPSESSCREVYDGFVMSWCITALNESLLGEDYLCNETYSPICIDEIEDQIRDSCPASCNGRLNCCFDNNVAGEKFLSANIEDSDTLVQTRATSFAPGETRPPQFLTDITSITVTPLTAVAGGSDADSLAVFEVIHEVAISDLTCSVCNGVADTQGGGVLDGYEVECVVTGIGNLTAQLDLRALSLPAGEFSCTATEQSGKAVEIFVDVLAAATVTTSTTTSVSVGDHTHSSSTSSTSQTSVDDLADASNTTTTSTSISSSSLSSGPSDSSSLSSLSSATTASSSSVTTSTSNGFLDPSTTLSRQGRGTGGASRGAGLLMWPLLIVAWNALA